MMLDGQAKPFKKIGNGVYGPTSKISKFHVFPQTVYCWGSQCCLKCVRLGWGAVSASLSLSPVTQFVSPFVSHLTLAGVLCPPRWACLRSCLPICLPPGFVFDLGWGAVSASLGLSPNLSPIWLCLSPWLGCCVRLAGLVSQFVSQFVFHLALSFTSAGVLCPPRWACLPICLPPGFVFGLVCGLVSQFVSPLAVCPSFLSRAGVLCPPRWACLRSCLPICLPICLPSGFVSPFVSHLALSFTLASPSSFVFHLGWGAVSASLGLVSSLVSQCVSQFVSHLALSPSFVSPFVPHLAFLSPWLGCCVRLAGLIFGLVSQFVSHLALSFTLGGVLCPPRWACLPICLPICLPPGFVFHLGWGAVSASLGLSPNLSPIWLRLSPWLGCCVRFAGLVCGLVSQFVSHLALAPSFLSPFVSHLALSFTLAGVLCTTITYRPTYLPTYNAPNCKSVRPSAVGPCPHFSCIAPSPYPPCIGACSGMPPVRATTKSEVQRSHFRPAQLCWVWPCQDYCLEPRPRKLSRACVGLAKRSPPTPWTEPFDGLPHGQSLVLLSQG